MTANVSISQATLTTPQGTDLVPLARPGDLTPRSATLTSVVALGYPVPVSGGGTGLTYKPDANYCNTPTPPFDTFTYTLVSGTGSTDNTSFAISGSTLQTAAIFNFEAKNSYSIRLRTTDQGGLWFEKAFTISVTNVYEIASVVGRKIFYNYSYFDGNNAAANASDDNAIDTIDDNTAR